MPLVRAAGIVGAVFGQLPDVALDCDWRRWALRQVAAEQAIEALGGRW